MKFWRHKDVQQTLMASSSSTVTLRGLEFPRHTVRNFGFVQSNLRFSLILPRVPTNLLSTLALSRRSNRNSAITSSKKKRLPQNDDADEDYDEDAIDALFNQLEEDLKSDLSMDDGDGEISEEDLARLEQELEEALGSDDELSEMFSPSADRAESGDDAEESEDEEERPIKLKNWQLRRLASALKIGRRKTSIKNLASELCLDRAVVLELLRDPPPNLLLMAAALPEKVMPAALEPEAKPVELSHMEATVDVVEPVPQVDMPVHVRQSRWSMQKRLKKVQVETLERVYNRTKRPTNAMISSIVHVTNLPRKRVVKWFEDKRAEDGVPNYRLPYQRSTPETNFAD